MLTLHTIDVDIIINKIVRAQIHIGNQLINYSSQRCQSRVCLFEGESSQEMPKKNAEKYLFMRKVELILMMNCH